MDKHVSTRHTTPVSEIEPKLATILFAIGYYKNPQSVFMVIELANAVIKGTSVEHKLKECQKKVIRKIMNKTGNLSKRSKDYLRGIF